MVVYVPELKPQVWLGCTMCIFAGDCGRMAKDVKISCENNPEQYEELDRLEAETGYTMSIQGVRVRDIVKKGKF